MTMGKTIKVSTECHGREFLSYMNKLYQNDTFCDVTIKSMEDEEIKAHGIILAAFSPYFRTSFNNEKTTFHFNNISIQTIRSIIDYLYNGKIEVEKDCIEDVYRMATFLEITTLFQNLKKIITKEENNDKKNAGVADTLEAKNVQRLHNTRFANKRRGVLVKGRKPVKKKKESAIEEQESSSCSPSPERKKSNTGKKRGRKRGIEKNDKKTDSLGSFRYKSTGGKPTCLLCKKEMEGREEVTKHRKEHSDDPRLDDAQCHICGLLYKNKETMMSHVRRVHCEPEYPCKICHKIFKTKPLALEHEIMHKVSNQFSCTVCNVEFRNKNDLLLHSTIHEEIKSPDWDKSSSLQGNKIEKMAHQDTRDILSRASEAAALDFQSESIEDNPGEQHDIHAQYTSTSAMAITTGNENNIQSVDTQTNSLVHQLPLKSMEVEEEARCTTEREAEQVKS